MMPSLRSCTRYPSGATPPSHIPFFFEAAIFSRMRSTMTSRSNCAKDNSTLRVRRPIEVVVLNCCVTETNDALLAPRISTIFAARHLVTAHGAVDTPVWHCQINFCRARSAERNTRSRCGNRISPLIRRLGSEDPERRARDEMALKVEGVVNGGMHAEEALRA